jgi:prevent-host-death family protein
VLESAIKRRLKMDVGVRELRDGLSRHLATVRDGHTITVTDHGKPVARIVPVGAPTILERLVAEGRVTPGRRRRRPRPAPAKTGGMVSDLVNEQRR